MSQEAFNINEMDGWLEFCCEDVLFTVLKKEEYFDEDEWKEREDTDFTSDELNGPICMTQGEKDQVVKIEGLVKFKDGVSFDEPDGGWNLSNFIKMVEGYEWNAVINRKTTSLMVLIINMLYGLV